MILRVNRPSESVAAVIDIFVSAFLSFLLRRKLSLSYHFLNLRVYRVKFGIRVGNIFFKTAYFILELFIFCRKIIEIITFFIRIVFKIVPDKVIR